MFIKFDKTLIVLFSNFFFKLNSFFNKHSILLGRPQYAYDFSKLSLILCLENMLKFSPWGHSKGTYAPKQEGRGAQKAC